MKGGPIHPGAFVCFFPGTVVSEYLLYLYMGTNYNTQYFRLWVCHVSTQLCP